MNWINIKDSKPKLNERVLVYPTGENVVISMLENGSSVSGINWQDDDFNNFDFHTVKWWMPLPKRPKKIKK